MKNKGSYLALAHEIGHACGWSDIYYQRDGIAELDEENLAIVIKDWLSDDWNHGEDVGFYHVRSQRDIVRRLLMLGVDVGTHADIPCGCVLGVLKNGEVDFVNVGVSGWLHHSPVSL